MFLSINIFLIEWLTDWSASRPKMKLFILTIIILLLFTQNISPFLTDYNFSANSS